MATYWEKLKDPRWQKKRLEILERDGWECRWCGDHTETLNVDHGYYERGRDPWDYENRSLATLCETCHKMVGDYRLQAQREMALIGPERIWSIWTLLSWARKLLDREGDKLEATWYLLHQIGEITDSVPRWEKLRERIFIPKTSDINDDIALGMGASA